MAIKTTCYVTAIIETGAAFAVRADNDEGVYISAATANALELEDMDEIEAVLVRNKSEKGEGTPWFARRARLMEDCDDE